MIKYAIDYETQEPLCIRYECFSLEDATLHLNEKFDIIIADFILQDVKNYFLVLKELEKLLNDSGKLIAILEHPFTCIFDEVHVTTKRIWEDKIQFDGNWSALLRYQKGRVSKIFWTDNLWTTTYHHRLEEYYDSFSKVGLTICNIKEPIVSASEAIHGPEKNLANEIPMFMLIESTKISIKGVPK